MKRSNQIGWAQVRAGVFIFAALLFLAMGIILMGQKTKMFVSKSTFTVTMDDVAGLKVGAPVWLAGVDVGIVNDLKFADPRKSNEVEIGMEVDSAALRKIWNDSKITVKTRGLMGEKYVDITPSLEYHETPPSTLKGTSVAKMDDVVQKAGVTFEKINTIIDNVNKGKGTLGKLTVDEALYNNVATLATELKDLAYTINKGDGTLGRLNRSREPYEKMMAILNRAEGTLKDIQASDGSLNRLIYDKTLYDKMVSLADKSINAADDVRELNKKLTSRESTIGKLIGDREFYDKGMSVLTRADNSVNALEEITSRIKNGEGTLGKAVNDKELYEKLSRMVEDVDLLVRDIKLNPGRYVKLSLF